MLTIAQGCGDDDGDQGGAEDDARKNVADLASSRTTWTASTVAQGGGDHGKQGGAEGGAERREAVEPTSSRSTLIASKSA